MMGQKRTYFYIIPVLVLAAALLSGCGILFGGSEEAPPTPTQEPRAVVPTWTPTPEQAATATPEAAAVQQTQVITVAVKRRI